MVDLMKPQLVGTTVTTPSAAAPEDAASVIIAGRIYGRPPGSLRRTLFGLYGSEWRPILEYAWPGPEPAAVEAPTAARVRVEIDPSEPVSLGEEITFS